MYKLININNVDFTDPEGTFTLKRNDVINEYESENGHKTVEIIRQGVLSASVSYKGLTDTQINTMLAAITTVSTVKLYNPITKALSTITAKITGLSFDKIYHRNDLSVWKLSFDIQEL